MRKVLLYFALKYKGDFNKIFEAIKEKEAVTQQQLDEVEKKIKCNYITLIDNNYPNYLKHISTPPFVLFYYGDISLLTRQDNIAIIGKRNNSEYAKKMCEKLVDELSNKNRCIVSGMALGIDGIAHKRAIKNNIKTIAVLGGGIDNIYPLKNAEIYNEIKKNGLIISEYPNTLSPEPANFLIRNRIIAAIVKDIIVVEADYKSGTMNTVSYGLDYGKEIYALPYLANSNSGCNYLIKQGAKLIETIDDIE